MAVKGGADASRFLALIAIALSAPSYPFAIEALPPGKRILYVQNTLGFDFKIPPVHYRVELQPANSTLSFVEVTGVS